MYHAKILPVFPLLSCLWHVCVHGLEMHIQECCKMNGTHFCHLLQLHDEDYCFPQVLQNLFLSCSLGLLLELCPAGCVQLCLAEVASSLRHPVLIAHAADRTHHAFTAEQLGLIRAWLPNGSWLEEPFLDIQSLLLAAPWLADKRGFHPKQKDKGEKIRINKLKVLASDANKIDPSSERILLELGEPATKRPFWKIWEYSEQVSRRAGESFVFSFSAFRSTLLGKVLRIDVDGRNPDGKPYHIPPDNPFMSDPKACPGVYAYGVSNMVLCNGQRGPYHKKRKREDILWGWNDGWRAKEGFECFNTKLCHNSSMDDTLPILSYGCSVDKSVTGGFVYRGCESPNLNVLYIFGDFLDKKTNKWKKQDISVGSTTSCAFPGMISSYSKFIISFAEDEAGGNRAGHTFNGNCTVCSLCMENVGNSVVPEGCLESRQCREVCGWSVAQGGLLPCEAVADQVDEKFRKPNLM
uniref:HHIP like 2 n=1 Tax=Junco hyemalis TaxID=40217 RepID=A0A8C5ILU0_JUNHY